LAAADTMNARQHKAIADENKFKSRLHPQEKSAAFKRMKLQRGPHRICQPVPIYQIPGSPH
jgi:hypothetical protein